MAEDLILFLGVGAFLILVGVLQILNIRHALKTGIIAAGLRDTSGVQAFDRTKNPIFYQLNFWPCLFASVVLPVAGVASIGFGIFLAVKDGL